MGMTYEQYWDGPPSIATMFRKAHKLRRKLDNENAWLCGMYVYDAVSVAVGNAFGKKGTRKQQYLDKPLDIFPLTEEEKKLREQEEYNKMQEAMEAMARHQRAEKLKGDV